MGIKGLRWVSALNAGVGVRAQVTMGNAASVFSADTAVTGVPSKTRSACASAAGTGNAIRIGATYQSGSHRLGTLHHGAEVRKIAVDDHSREDDPRIGVVISIGVHIRDMSNHFLQKSGTVTRSRLVKIEHKRDH